MSARRRVIGVVAAGIILGFASVAQNQPAPQGPFKTVHLVTLDAAQEKSLTHTLAQINAALTRAGFPNLRYRLYKVAGNQQGPYTHLWEASWSGRAEYDKVHSLPVYQETSALLKQLEPIMQKEVYNRIVEIPIKE
jgi:hypothetical protein